MEVWLHLGLLSADPWHLVVERRRCCVFGPELSPSPFAVIHPPLLRGKPLV